MALPVNIDDLIRHRRVESARIEYKKDWNPELVVHSVCAFANDIDNWGGGYVVLPIHPAFLNGYEAPKGENNLFAQPKPSIGTEKQYIGAEKQAIGLEKPSIGDGKPSVDVLKPSIGDVLSSVRLAKKVYANIVNLYAVVGESEVFGRSRVMEILSLSNGPAGELLVKMAALNLIIPITGQGKGKYRFNLQPPTGGIGS